MAALIGAVMLLQFAAGGPVDDDAPLPPPLVDKPVVRTDPAVDRRLRCIMHFESKGYPLARNPSGASGLFQFLPSTWAGTPPGRRGASIFDVDAQWEAARWMAHQGRWREWVPVARGLC